MNTEREKKIPATPTGRRYSSVDELASGEVLSPEVRKRLAELKTETVIVEALVGMRQSAGLTQQKLAEMLDKSQGAVSKLESGSDEDLTVGEMMEYSRATNERFMLLIGKPMNHVECVKWHAFGIREHLSALAKMAHEDDGLEQAIKAFFGEAFFNILEILSKCQNEMPHSKDVQVRIRPVGNAPRRLRGQTDEAVPA
jgi:transcriptional regulator with XRE-family HTH domain